MHLQRSEQEQEQDGGSSTTCTPPPPVPSSAGSKRPIRTTTSKPSLPAALRGRYELHSLRGQGEFAEVWEVGLKTDGNISVPTRSVFHFCPSVSIFVGFHFRIYGSRNEISPSVFEESRFYMELTRIYSVFHPVFNLHKICLKIDMFKNIPITKYVC